MDRVIPHRINGSRVGSDFVRESARTSKTAMFLKNYTSDAPVSQTIYRIEQVLIKCGVLSIEKEYGPNAEVVAVRFKINDQGREFYVRMPADREKALNALWMDYVGTDKLSGDGKSISDWGSRKKKNRTDFAQQAERTAWKIVQDWIEVQMSMIQMQQADAVEVFLPYVWDGRTTVYNRIKQNGYAALLPEKATT